MLVDAHAHLDKYSDADLETVLAEIAAHRILTWTVATDLPSHERNLTLAKRSPWIAPTFGVHPNRAPLYATRLSEVGRWIERSPALGEIGLDFHWVKESGSYAAQKKVFEYFLAAAREQDKPVNLHTKGAEKETLALLEHYAPRRVVVHWYSGPLDILQLLVDCGAYFTFGVELLSSEKIRELARAVPIDRLLTETDNPGGLKWLAGEIGMPSVLTRVIDELAAVKKVSRPAVERAVEENFKRVAGELWPGAPAGV